MSKFFHFFENVLNWVEWLKKKYVSNWMGMERKEDYKYLEDCIIPRHHPSQLYGSEKLMRG